MNSQSCPESLRSARWYHWEWCTINNELRTTSGRRVLGGRPRQPMGPCNSGYWASPSASPVGVNGRRRCCGSQGRVPGGACIFPISVWSGTACLLNRLLVLPDALHCSYPVSEKSAHRRASFLGTHNTFWRSLLPRRALQTRAGRLARQGPSFSVRTCTKLGGENGGHSNFAKTRPVHASWDAY